ncbi:hypothetical protein O3M35_003486 [Rhynocoris fuscipes]|uniref:Uncharacterized protein n=1 Tax=Rhynocoris fuscipes TaxID=488301 RepID=A0AAW1CMM3_9HEMI
MFIILVFVFLTGYGECDQNFLTGQSIPHMTTGLLQQRNVTALSRHQKLINAHIYPLLPAESNASKVKQFVNIKDPELNETIVKMGRLQMKVKPLSRKEKKVFKSKVAKKLIAKKVKESLANETSTKAVVIKSSETVLPISATQSAERRFDILNIFRPKQKKKKVVILKSPGFAPEPQYYPVQEQFSFLNEPEQQPSYSNVQFVNEFNNAPAHFYSQQHQFQQSYPHPQPNIYDGAYSQVH